ncbi:DNA mismatch repair protein MutS [Aureibacter tunicatorum]|uniref:DNA mismatch repair protein MutS n=1 Tax=Aureibacter tunicatorum TaxID=866807 RepID=A0AAE3XJH9_9BACT|nr:DNA mismatch repair protein MutS [Aureibacter tunicatorum]MDR6237590.1 DNA mismatch repair protein MutS [Aureibacter tunicatorum]BDD02624.1 DNA mismatch repair protein MutS [Aureibacter tunicatorum]
MAKTSKSKKAAGGKETPLMRQYNEIKKKYPGALLLFRVGDFYETFGEDAVKASKVLEIVLTKRGAGSSSETELAGFPHHSLDSYLPRLVRAGYRVAICDQLEDPKSVKGIVKRGVTELVTPGLAINDNVLEQKSNNFLASVYFGKKGMTGLSLLDLSTGEFMVANGSSQYVDNLMKSFSPSEIIYCKAQRKQFEEYFSEEANPYALEDWAYSFDFAFEQLTHHFKTQNLKGFGVDNVTEGVVAAGAIIHYLKETEHKEIGHITHIARLEKDKYVWLDKFTVQNLEILTPQHDAGVALVDVIDKTLSPMGARMLRKWAVLPLKESARIKERLDAVEALEEDGELHENICKYLKNIGDVERLISKVAVGRINPREMLQLKKALGNIGPIKQLLHGSDADVLRKISDQLNHCQFLFDKIDAELKDDVPIVSNLGNLIREGIDGELDELRAMAFSGKDYLAQIQKREMERTGIPSLKIAYNKVFGYYLEVTNAHKDKVPEEWIRKQTLVNAERYITEELKTYEEKILSAEGKLVVIEQRIYQELVSSAMDYIEPIQQNAKAVAMLDCLCSFAQVALDYGYCKPTILESKGLNIKDGRHPVIERQMGMGEEYVPNDISLSPDDQQIAIITGPNMSGKSALLRQTALIVLMAQMGSFVPASQAELGIVDKVFTRVGASDNLAKGESTFMVEMTETASIMNNLSDRSLVLMDEIGRGTSTYDGVSIAWSIVEFLHNHPKFKAKTLFATHYHELNELANDFPRIKNFNVSVKERMGKVIFMRKLSPGGTAHSFGINVAQLAGMPDNIVDRAREILTHLEENRSKEHFEEKVRQVPKNNYQLSLFEAEDPAMKEVKQELEKLDVNAMTPIEALMKLNEIKSMI